MKLGCTQTDLSFNLSLVSRAVPSRPTGHPILANVLLTADAGTQRVSLTAFDLSLGIQTSFPAQVEASGAITLPARLLNDIVTKLPSQTHITLEKDEQEAQVSLVSSSGHYQVRGMGAEEYPELPLVESGEAIQLPGPALAEGLRGTLFATSGDETKQVLTGVHLTVRRDGLEFASTDGHRLAVVQTDNAAAEEPSGSGEFEVTVPARALRDLERLLASSTEDDTIALYFDQGQTVFQWGDQYLTSRTLDGQYPNYRQLIPQQFERQMTVDRKALQSALDRIAVLADQKNNVVKLQLDAAQQQVLLSVEAQDVGSGQEAVEAQISGDSLEIAFNVKYLMDGLKAMVSPEIQMQLNSATSPVVLTPLGATKMTYLVMPVQIRN
ncbi:MAG: DNA polymerase III subunit beta [Prochlorothrix sp.]|nr:DNA polymerase III subunit beta [Prochlorothrix sp.]